MLIREGERLKELNPFSMSCVQLVLTIGVGRRLVIRMEHKGLRLEVMTPIFQSPNNGIEVHVINGVLEPRTIQLFTKES